MSLHCNYCNISFTHKSKFNRHINTKKHINNTKMTNLHKNATRSAEMRQDATGCAQDTKNINHAKLIDNKCINKNILINKKYHCKFINDEYICIYCDSKFKDKRYIKKHLINTCELIPINIKNTLVTKHNNDKRTNKILNIVDRNYQPISSKVNNINYGTINNNIWNIKFVGIGRENLEHFKREDIKEIFGSGKGIVKTFLTKTYENKDNINTLIDLRNKKISFLNTEMKIETGDLNEYLDELIDIHFETINKLFFENKDKLTDSEKNSFYKIWEGYYNTYYMDEEEDHNIDGVDFTNPFNAIKLIEVFMKHMKLKLLDVRYIAKDKLDKFTKICLSPNTEHVIIKLEN